MKLWYFEKIGSGKPWRIKRNRCFCKQSVVAKLNGKEQLFINMHLQHSSGSLFRFLKNKGKGNSRFQKNSQSFAISGKFNSEKPAETELRAWSDTLVFDVQHLFLRLEVCALPRKKLCGIWFFCLKTWTSVRFPGPRKIYHNTSEHLGQTKDSIDRSIKFFMTAIVSSEAEL